MCNKDKAAHSEETLNKFLNCIKPFQLGLVCFRAKGSDKLNQKLLSTINDSGKLHMVPARVNQRFTIRFALAAPNATASDVGEPIVLSSFAMYFASFSFHDLLFLYYRDGVEYYNRLSGRIIRVQGNSKIS